MNKEKKIKKFPCLVHDFFGDVDIVALSCMRRVCVFAFGFGGEIRKIIVLGLGARSDWKIVVDGFGFWRMVLGGDLFQLLQLLFEGLFAPSLFEQKHCGHN